MVRIMYASEAVNATVIATPQLVTVKEFPYTRTEIEFIFNLWPSIHYDVV